MKMNKLYVPLTGLNGWVFDYELSGYRIDSRWSYLSFKYHNCFEQGTPWHSGNYRKYIHSKTRMWYDGNTQLKTFSLLYTTLLNYSIYYRVKASSILYGGTMPVAPSKNRVKAISFDLIRKTFPVFQIFISGPQEDS